MGEQIHPATKRRRARHLIDLLQKQSMRNKEKYIGKIVPVLVEGPSPETDLLIQGRMLTQAQEIDGHVLITRAPVTYLLFLEKQLVDLHTFLKKLPVLDASESWVYDAAQDCFATEAVETLRTRKVPRNHVKAEATEKHPAQVEVYYEDITVGFWRTVKFSGALPARRVAELLERVEKLQRAVKFAREEANAYEVKNQKVGEALFSFLFK
jgi:hypothetical protein